MSHSDGIAPHPLSELIPLKLEEPIPPHRLAIYIDEETLPPDEVDALLLKCVEISHLMMNSS